MSAMIEAGKNSPMYFAFCAALPASKVKSTGSRAVGSTPASSQQASKSLGVSLARHEAPVEIDGLAARALQVLYRGPEPFHEALSPRIAPKSALQLIPVSPMDSWWQESGYIELRYHIHNNTLV